MRRYITFVVYDADNRVCNIYQLSENTRHNFKWWFGAIRDRERGNRVTVTTVTE